MPGIKEVTFSAREMEVLALAWQCMETPPKIDMVKLAALTGYTPGSASVTLGNIKRKIKLVGDSAAADASAASLPAPTAPTSTPRKRKTKNPLENKSPTKSAKKSSPAADARSPSASSSSSAAAAAAAPMDPDDEDLDDVVAVKKEEPMF
ncbi:hypothetical protein ACJQWK_11114 [Exserohilum turcicum]|uniref:Uncharacterized protein n=1 Tax=Exserohilum turcicum (strain 28A) TaxID=671987 RepID=R0JKB6_EXST2|nr:uncharacterized protein SETTUDRAFT_181858 [Exserohilum turcica Et28A]EOA81738.1 hypothetical protein SETTUDRAFT_181858 [Exserohilum turcica Et28A]